MLRKKVKLIVDGPDGNSPGVSTILTPGQAMRLAARLQRWAMGLMRRHSPIGLLMLAMWLSGCGADTVPSCPAPPTPAGAGQECPRELTGKGHCYGGDILYCGGTKWSLVKCPKGTKCEDVGTGVGCF